jgi:hypothetical protein
MLKKWLLGLLVVSALVLGAVTMALAQDDTTVPVDLPDFGRVLMFRDGRINAFDMAAPVAIYYTHETVSRSDGSTIAVPNGIQLLAIEPETGNGRLVLDAEVDELEDLADGAVSSISNDGFILRYRSGTFWVTAPPDNEGKVYNFIWQNRAIPLVTE